MKFLKILGLLDEAFPSPTKKSIPVYLGQFFFIVCIYFLSVRLGLIFSMSNHVSVFWPAAGVGIALLHIFGLSFWPAIAIGTLLSNKILGGSPISILGISIANILQAIMGVLFLEMLERKKLIKGIHAFSLHIFFAVMMASIVSASLGVPAIFFGKNLPWSTLQMNWSTWFLGDFMGGILFTPLILAFVNNKDKKTSSFLPSLTLLGVAAYLGHYLFFKSHDAGLMFLIFPFILICAMLLGERSSKLIITICSMLVLYLTKIKTNIFYFGNIDSNFIHFQILLFGASVAGLFVSDFKRNGILKSVFVILMSGWLASALLFFTFYHVEYEKKLDEFNNIVKHSIMNVHTQMATNSTALRSGVGLFSANDNIVSRKGWANFSTQLDLQNFGSGIRGLGVVYRVASKNIAMFEKKHQRDGFKNFKVHGLKGFTLQPPFSYVITYLEPLSLNLPAIGLDLAVEPNRKMAADLAVDTGELTISKSITLVQDNTKAKGFLIYYPLYNEGLPHANLAERRESAIGWVYAPVRAVDLFSASLGRNSKDSLSYRVLEVDTGIVLAESADFKSLADLNQSSTKFNLANRTFLLQAKPSASFLWDINTYSLWIGLCGVGITFLLGSFVSFIQLQKNRANHLVEERTKQLELSGRMAKLGGWEFNVLENQYNFSNIFKEMVGMKKNSNFELDSIFSLNEIKISQAFNLCLNNGSPWDFEVEINTFDHSMIWVRTIGEAKYINGTIEKIHGTFQDISQRKILEKQLVLERSKSLHSSKLASLGEMSAGIAHEINNPLAIISAAAELLPKAINDPIKLESRIDSILKSCERISRIVSALKKFSRSSEKPTYKQHSLGEIIKESIILVDSKSKKFMTPVQFELSPDLFILCDEVEMEQVLVNLINNSIDAIKEKEIKWVKIEAFESMNSIVLRITDSGHGIPENIKTKLFEPFFTTKIVGEGTGLGLSITKGILDEHNANIEILTRDGHTCFEIYFQKIKEYSVA